MTSDPLTEQPPPESAGDLAAVILAAGMGTRMKSRLPKVLHPLVGLPLVGHVLRALAPLAPARTVLVVGHGGEQVQAALGPAYTYVTQQPQQGTGHAVLQAHSALAAHHGPLLVLYGDTPLLQPATLTALVARHRAQPGTRVTLLTSHAADPSGYGRVLRDAAGRVTDIVEERVATPAQRALQEINSGLYCFDSAWLWPRLAALPRHPGAGEYYLTDMIAVASAEAAGSVATLALDDMDEVAGINNRVQLAEADRVLRDRIRRYWMLAGVTLLDPATTYIDADVTLGQDTTLYPGCILEGATTVGDDCRLGPNARLIHATVGDSCTVGMSLLEHCTLEAGVDVGSFNHLRPGAYLSSGVHLGNFAEVKNSHLGPQVAMGHFSYLGDADVGAGTNIGAGTITVNLGADGQKHRTTIGAGAFIGSDSLLIAPVTVGPGAMTGAGAVVNHDVAPDTLVVGMPARPLRRRTPAPS